MLRIGSLFSGYEGIALALKAIWPDAETVFVADVCKHTKTKDGRHEVGHHEPHRAPCSILAHRFPDVPNLGDVSLIKALGNGVVWQQAEAAIRWLWQYVPASARAAVLGVAA